MAKLAIHALVGYIHPSTKNSLKTMGLSTPIRPPPSADARLLRDLKEQVTVLQKDISQQAQRGNGRRMVIKNPNEKCGVGVFFSQDFFHSLQLTFNLQWFGQKESVCDFMSENFHYEHSKFFQRT